MTDLQIVELPFGGRAFVPLSERAKDWCLTMRSVYDGSFYLAGGTTNNCMASYYWPAFGCEPHDFDDLFNDATNSRLRMETVDGNTIVREN